MSDTESPVVDNSKLVAKLAEACDEVKGVEKKGTNEAQRYKYQKAADVAKAMRHELFSRGIVIIPDEQAPEYVVIEGVNRDGKATKQTEVRLQTDYHIMGHGGEIIMAAFGVARDSGDKALWKAKTGAIKYFLRGLGLIPDEKEDPEYDGDKPERATEVDDSEQEPKPFRLAGLIKDAKEAELAWWFVVETLANEGVVEVKIKADKSLAGANMAEMVGYLVDMEVLQATSHGRPVPDMFILVRVVSVRKPEEGKPQPKPSEAPKSSPIAKKQASTKLMDVEYVDPDKERCPECKASFGVHLKTCSHFRAGKLNVVGKASDTLIDKSMLITLQTARKRVKIPDQDYYNMLGSYGYEHANEVRVIDLPKILNEINEYKLTVTAQDEAWAEGRE